MKKYWRDYLFLLLFTGFIIGLDQSTKAIVRDNLLIGDMWSPWEWLTPYVRIVHWYNTGVAFGLFQDQGLIFTVLGIFVVGAIIFYYPRVESRDWPLRLAMGMQLGGAIGNLIDRLVVGHVTDFISVGNFPVFNIADASISVGVGVLLLGVWYQERREKREKSANKTVISPIDGMMQKEEIHCE